MSQRKIVKTEYDTRPPCRVTVTYDDGQVEITTIADMEAAQRSSAIRGTEDFEGLLRALH